MFRRRATLRGRLTARLVLFQALAIFIVAFTGLYALMLRYGIEGVVIGERDPEIVAQAVERGTDGTLAIRETPELSGLRARSPGLWFVVVDRGDGRLVEGEVPETYRGIAASLASLGTANFADTSGDGALAASIRVAESPAGRVHVLVGGSPVQSVSRAVLAVTARAVVPIVLTLAFVAILAIAWIIRREFRGVDRAAGLAATIDVGKRGTRLPEEALPAEIVPLVRAVNDALGRLDEGYARQRRFLADAAHELKTPIAILHTRVETSPPGPERDRRLLLDIARLGNLAEQLLDTQRLDHSSDTFAPVDLVELARTVGADLAPVAIAAGYEFAFDAARPRFVVRGDRPALERAIVNLVQNAVAHGGGSGIITLRVDADGVLEVVDQGAGIPAGDRDRVFEPFYRTQPSSRGAGLGLTIVGDIVGRHGGRIAVEDAQPSGSIFRLTLPEADPAPARRQPQKDRARTGA